MAYEGLMLPTQMTLLFVALILVLLTGWYFHLRHHNKKLFALCEQLAQDQFYISLLNTILHDILNPIVAAKYSLENLKNQSSEEHLPYVEKAMGSIDELCLLVKRVRDMRAFDTGKKSLQFTKVSVNKVLRMIENTFRDRTRAKGIRLVVKKDKKSSVVEIDPIVFTSYVLNNIVDNSIKFSKSGSLIEITCYPVGDEVEFIVKDQGSGMSESSVCALMEGKFDDICADSTEPKGLGIGMKQVATYLELAGGSVHVESRTQEQSPNDHGTIYKVKIPKSQNSRGTE